MTSKGAIMRLKIAAAIAIVGFALPSQTFAWSENGHQTVDAIADILIQGSNAVTQRNNSNCPYDGKYYEWHNAFHFADVDIEHNSYSTSYVLARNDVLLILSYILS
jgi:hypothetical protein